MLAFRSILLAAALGGVLSAQTLIIPAPVSDGTTEGNSSTSYPWNRDSSTPSSNDIRVQYVYDSSNLPFASPVVITGARWRSNGTSSSWTGGTWSICNIACGPASVDWDSLSTSNTFDANHLGGVTPPFAYSGPVTLQAGSGNGFGVPGPWYVSVTFQNPVFYNPTTSDDFIVDIAHNGDWSGTTSGAWASDTQTTGSMTKRVYNFDWTAASPSGGSTTSLVCELTYSLAPGLYPGFSVDKTEVFLGEVVKFTDASSTSEPGGITEWAWDFDNDGTWDSTRQNPTWTYFTCGPKTVTLRVRDGVNPEAFETKVDLIDTPGATASFTATPTVGPPPLAVQFTDTSTTIDPAGIQSWAWDFDDDGSIDSTAQNPMYVYGTADVFTARLTVVGRCGSPTDATTTIDTRLQLCTLFASNNGGADDGAVYFDLNVLNPSGITVTNLKSNFGQTAGTSGVGLDVWVRSGTADGFEQSPDGWYLVSTGTGTAAGDDNPTEIDIADFCLPSGLWGMALVAINAEHEYTNGNGSNEFYSNGDIELTLGAANNTPFSSSTFSPRVWNGCIIYDIGGLSTGSVTNIAAGCLDSMGRTASVGGLGGSVPAIGSLYTVEMSNAPMSQPLSAVIIGFTLPGPADLGIIGMPGCILYPAVDAVLPAPTDALGSATVVLDVPANPALGGNPFFCQGITADFAANPFGAVLSNCAAFTVGCQ